MILASFGLLASAALLALAVKCAVDGAWFEAFVFALFAFWGGCGVAERIAERRKRR